MIRVNILTQKKLHEILSWAHDKARISFIFIAQTIEKTVFQLINDAARVLIFFESMGLRIADMVTRRISGVLIKSRRVERLPVESGVMIKKSAFDNEIQASKLQYLGEGVMKDFSRGGAQLFIPQGHMANKDFLSLMYKNRHGKWVSVESQIRWVVSTTEGDQVVGVQFLAVSA